MQSLLKFLAHIAKSFGISSPSDNARKCRFEGTEAELVHFHHFR
jgi:hypothetical protein